MLKLDVRKRPWDLFICCTVATIAAVLALTEISSSVRVLAGLIFVLFLPGYAVVSALFPRERDMTFLERIALSFGLSIAVVALLGLGLNYTPWGITLSTVVTVLYIFTLITSGIGWYRRINISLDERFGFVLQIKIPEEEFSSMDKVLVVIICLLVIVSAVLLVHIVLHPKPGEKFTEFAILGKNKMAENYPTKLNISENGTLYVWVRNNEYTTISYTIVVFATIANSAEQNEISRTYVENLNQTFSLEPNHAIARKISIEHEQEWLEQFWFNLTKPGKYKLRFLLYIADGTHPYEWLQLLVNVV